MSAVLKPVDPWAPIPDTEAEFSRLLLDQAWRLNNLYMIKDKDGKKVRFRLNPAQWKFYKGLHNRNLILKARQLGFCLDPDTRVLKADLTWSRIADLVPGDRVVSVDENIPGGRGKGRKMRTATVEGCVEVVRDAYRITFDDGRSVVCTSQHPWLSRKVGTGYKWRTIGESKYSSGKSRLKIGTKVRSITRPWDDKPTYEDGWFGGMIDGEGSMSRRSGATVCVTQVDGPVWDRLAGYLNDEEYIWHNERDERIAGDSSKLGNKSVNKAVISRMNDLFRLLGITRPSRFITREWWVGKELPGKRTGETSATIVNIEQLPDQTMIDLQTSTGTYIAEGFVSHNTTFMQIFILDSCMFISDTNAGVVAHNQSDAQSFFKDKILYAYNELHPWIKAMHPAKNESAGELRFENGSVIRVATSLRSGTLQILHISEYGKLCAMYPDRAQEVQTGTLPTVPMNGIVVIESTAEGRSGDFFDKAETSRHLMEEMGELTVMDYKFHFFPWWETDEYSLDARVAHTNEDNRYFELLKSRGIDLTEGQQAWYIKTRIEMNSGEADSMRREYPSYAEEAFEASVTGAYFAKQMSYVRARGQILNIPIERNIPIHTFWDLGRDTTAIWFFQNVGFDYRFINYFANSGEDIAYYIDVLNRMKDGDYPYLYGEVYLPHDGDRKSLASKRTVADALQANGYSTRIVMRTPSKAQSIENARRIIPKCYFDRTRCADGIKALDGYRKEWDPKLSDWKPNPLHDVNSHGADGFMTFADGFHDESEIQQTSSTENHSSNVGQNHTTGY